MSKNKTIIITVDKKYYNDIDNIVDMIINYVRKFGFLVYENKIIKYLNFLNTSDITLYFNPYKRSIVSYLNGIDIDKIKKHNKKMTSIELKGYSNYTIVDINSIIRINKLKNI